MSSIGKAVGKVFKSVGNFVKKYWKAIAIAVAVYFTAGAALAYFGAAGAAGGAAAVGAEGAAAGAAAEGGAAAALGAGAADLGGAGVLTAEGAAAAGIGADAAATGAGVLGGGSVLAGTAGIGGGSVLAGTAGVGGAAAGGDLLASSAATAAGSTAEAGYGSAITNGANYVGAPGAPSSLWQTSLNVAGQAMKTPGVPSLIGGLLNNYQQGQMMDAQMKYQAERAPGNITGGAGNAWQGFAQNKNLSPTTPMPSGGQLPPLTPYKLPPNQAGMPSMPGVNQPGSNSANYPGYGTPGYGQQYPPGTAPPGYPTVPGLAPMQDPNQQQGLLSQQTPFIESPYDESYV